MVFGVVVLFVRVLFIRDIYFLEWVFFFVESRVLVFVFFCFREELRVLLVCFFWVWSVGLFVDCVKCGGYEVDSSVKSGEGAC